MPLAIRTTLIALPCVSLLAACQTAGNPQVGNATATGALAGAALGAAVADDGDRLEGAAIGAAVGALTGNVIGRTSSGQCIYRAADGSQFVAAC
ncbi:glycine zipper domain-containing protein [Gemmobacter caeruleus]|uniref:glycine zipper domain-containing protein n=1 Tax=Gemmobacter caeruleus TaxID=2595004 RepID=UPI001EF0E542|nr:glycine zipper domain-containing protein [Gemmobacter caeruleus]